MLGAQRRTGKQPSNLELEDLDATLISAFLDYLEADRGNSPRTRNARLAAIHSIEERIAAFARQRELLMTIPGVKQRAAEVLIAEIGVDMTTFPTADSPQLPRLKPLERASAPQGRGHWASRPHFPCDRSNRD